MYRLLGILGIALALVIMVLNFGLVNIALPSIQQDFSATIAELQWLGNILGIAVSSSLLIMVRLAEAYGQKRVYLLGLVAITLASLGAGCAANIEFVIIAQGLIGLSSAVILPVSQILICNVFPDRDQGKAIGIWAGVIGASIGLGPIIGGLLIDLLNWRWIFFINLLIAPVALLLTIFFVKETPRAPHLTKIDWRAAALLCCAVATCVTGVMHGASWGWTSMKVILLFSTAIVASLLFYFGEKRAESPLFPEGVCRNRQFWLSGGEMFCLNFFVWSGFFLISLYLQNVLSKSVLTTGALMLLITGPAALLGTSLGRLCDRFGCKPFLMVGFLFLIVSALLQTGFSMVSSDVWVICALLSFGLGWLLIFGPSVTSARYPLPGHLKAAGAGIFTTLQEMGGTMGLAVAGTIFREQEIHSITNKLHRAGIAIPQGQDVALFSDPASLKSFLRQVADFSEDKATMLFREAFSTAYEQAMVSLIIVSCIGLILSFFLSKKRQN